MRVRTLSVIVLLLAPGLAIAAPVSPYLTVTRYRLQGYPSPAPLSFYLPGNPQSQKYSPSENVEPSLYEDNSASVGQGGQSFNFAGSTTSHFSRYGGVVSGTTDVVEFGGSASAGSSLLIHMICIDGSTISQIYGCPNYDMSRNPTAGYSFNLTFNIAVPHYVTFDQVTQADGYDASSDPVLDVHRSNIAQLALSTGIGNPVALSPGASEIPAGNYELYANAYSVSGIQQLFRRNCQFTGCVGQLLEARVESSASYSYRLVLTPVPIPAATWLFGSALGVFAWIRRKSGNAEA